MLAKKNKEKKTQEHSTIDLKPTKHSPNLLKQIITDSLMNTLKTDK